MKKLISAIALLTALMTANAQEKVKEVVSDVYDRNGLTVIVINRGDQYDENSVNFVNKLIIDDKFDANLIGTKTLFLEKDRTQPLTAAEVDSLVRNSGVSKEILGCIYNRKADGSMDDELVRYRGHYNANDQDVINAAAAKVAEQHLTWGESLVNSSYILVLDFFNITRPVDKKTGAPAEFYVLDANAYTYKVDCNSDKLNEFYMTSWASATDTPEQKAAARAAFDKFQLDVVSVASVKASSSNTGSLANDLGASVKDLGNSIKSLFKKSSKVEEGAEEQVEETSVAPVFADNSVEKAQNDAYADALFKLEKEISEWQVAVSVASVKPIKAKVGKKEGLSNGSRFRAYSYEEDEEGNLTSRKRGYLRATKVVDNRQFATGETEPSTFYQISGVKNIEEGWTLKQKKDIRLGVSLTGKVGGLSLSSANVDFDYLLHISKVGTAYALVNIGIDPLIYAQKIGEYPISNFNFSAGVGYGLHLGRFIELMPYAVFGADYMQLGNNGIFTYLNDEENKKCSAFFIEPGIRLSFQVAYPFSIYLKAGYDILFNTEDARTHYNWINLNLPAQYKHHSGVFGEIGFRYAF